MGYLPWIVGVTVGTGLALLGGVARAMSVRSERRRRGQGTANTSVAPLVSPIAAPPASAGPRVYVRDRVLYGPGGFTYRLTDDDLLWLGRSVTNEAGGHPQGTAAVIWAIAQYHALVLGPGGQRPKFSTLANMIRSYSVPVIPGAAQPGSAWCQAHPRLCTASLIQRRQTIQSAPWGSLPEVVRQSVTRFAQGTLSNPVPGAVDWDAAFTQARSSAPLVSIGGNNFGVGLNRRLYQG